MYYQKVYSDADIINCPVDVENITRNNWYTTKKGIDAVLGEFKRCAEQLGFIMED